MKSSSPNGDRSSILTKSKYHGISLPQLPQVHTNHQLFPKTQRNGVMSLAYYLQTPIVNVGTQMEPYTDESGLAPEQCRLRFLETDYLWQRSSGVATSCSYYTPLSPDTRINENHGQLYFYSWTCQKVPCGTLPCYDQRRQVSTSDYQSVVVMASKIASPTCAKVKVQMHSISSIRADAVRLKNRSISHSHARFPGQPFSLGYPM